VSENGILRVEKSDVYFFDSVFGLREKLNVRRPNIMGIGLNILRLPALTRCHVGRVRPSVLRALLVAANLGKQYDRTLKNSAPPIYKILTS